MTNAVKKHGIGSLFAGGPIAFDEDGDVGNILLDTLTGGPTSKLLDSSVPDIEPPIVPTPDIINQQAIDTAGDAAGRAQQIIEKRKRGRRSTILTGGLGLTSQANVRKPTILGTV
jgi:hypothetical protein